MRFPEVFQKLQRGPQVITLKDAAIISAYSGISSGDLVVDAGAGSGFLACYLGNLVKPAGKVVSYEIREEFAKLAEENVARAGLEKIVKIKVGDIYKKIDEKNVDVVTLDVPEPWKAVKNIAKALKRDGYVASYSPNVEQVKQFVDSLKQNSFTEIHTYEILQREMLIREEGCRPESSGILHTAYLTFARKR